MPKRHGNLFEQCFTMELLYAAYMRGRRGKRKAFSVMDFERNLGANLHAIHQELHSGTYQPKPYRHFIVAEPKPRQISAPAFRDVVVQHAVYDLIGPIFDRSFLQNSYGCRVAKGTHLASDVTQRYMREAAPDSFTLQLDIRRFYYTIDRDILRGLIERKIKDKRLVDLMMEFANDGRDALGVPIGNLLSQLYALIYLNPMDHFIKRKMKIKRYVRYVDDFIVWCDSREQAVEYRDQISEFIGKHLGLTLSRWTIAPIKRGVNFVGFRTWRKRRFVRKHSLYRFSRSLKREDTASLISIMGNALRTASFGHLCKRIVNEAQSLTDKLPILKWRNDHVYQH